MTAPWSRFRRCLAAALTLILVGCGSGGASFDPASPCTADGRYPGAYPALEAAVPRQFDGKPPDRLDSGRNCADASLGTLKRHDVSELRFAGGLWQRGSNSGTTLVVFDSPGRLLPEWLAEFYEAGARSGRKTERIETSDITVGGVAARRLDTLNDDSFQTVVVWSRNRRVVAALVASSVREVSTRAAHDAVVSDAIAALDAAG